MDEGAHGYVKSLIDSVYLLHVVIRKLSSKNYSNNCVQIDNECDIIQRSIHPTIPYFPGRRNV